MFCFAVMLRQNFTKKETKHVSRKKKLRNYLGGTLHLESGQFTLESDHRVDTSRQLVKKRNGKR